MQQFLRVDRKYITQCAMDWFIKSNFPEETHSIWESRIRGELNEMIFTEFLGSSHVIQVRYRKKDMTHLTVNITVSYTEGSFGLSPEQVIYKIVIMVIDRLKPKYEY